MTSVLTDDRRLTTAWAIMVGLTVISVGTSLAGGGEGTGVVASAVALGAAFIKARQLLDHFLDLRRAGPGWRSFFTFALAGLLVGILGIGLFGLL